MESKESNRIKKKQVCGSPFCVLSGRKSKILNYVLILYLKVVFISANSPGPDKMQHITAAYCGISSRSSLFAKVTVYSGGSRGGSLDPPLGPSFLNIL